MKARLKRQWIWVAAATVLAAAVMETRADEILIVPTTGTASHNVGARNGTKTIDGTELSTNAATGTTVPMSWPTAGNIADHTWVGASTAPTISWDLGALYVLSGFHLWNYNGSDSSGNRGIKTATVYASDDAVGAVTTNLGSMTFTAAPLTAGYTGEDYSLSVTTRYVRMVTTDVFPDNDGYTGLSEIRFVGTPVQPLGEVVKAVSATVSHSVGARTGTKTIDGTEMSTNPATGTPVPTTWASIEGSAYDGSWVGNSASPIITWDLGEAYLVGGFHLWNYNASDSAGNRGIKTATVHLSNDPTFATYTDSGSLTFAPAPLVLGYVGKTYSLPEPVKARYVRFNTTAVFPDNDGYTGLNEVLFIDVPPSGTVVILR
ncbi:MAG: discoidin domain-containing protein [Lentisphaerae bacterium]|nr:discoidin domain-containing protein [Lentisphaerota bacterium]